MVNQVSLAGAHDVVVSPDGLSVYAAGYNGGTGIVKYNFDLTGPTPFVAEGYNGHTRFTGMTFDSSGNLWAMQNVVNGAGSVIQFDSAGNELKSISDNALSFGFGIDFGPDGRLYAASLGGYFNYPGLVNCVAAIDVTNDTVTPFVTAHTGTVFGPKYLKGGSNFSPAPTRPQKFLNPARSSLASSRPARFSVLWYESGRHNSVSSE